MYEIAVINPRPKKSRRKARASQSKGVSKMAKRRKVRRGKGGRFVKASSAAPRKRKAASVASTPRRRRRRPAGARPAIGYVVGKKRIRRYKLNPRAGRRRRRSNPRLSIGGIGQQLVPAAYGAAGAVALDVALGYIPLPAQLKTGYAKHAVKIVGALGVGMLANKFLPGNAKAIGQGALTVAMYGLLKDVLVKFAPAVKGLGDYEEVIVTDYGVSPPLGAYLPNETYVDPATPVGVGAYMNDMAGDMAGLDY